MELDVIGRYMTTASMTVTTIEWFIDVFQESMITTTILEVGQWQLVGGFNFFLFLPLPGEVIQFD